MTQSDYSMSRLNSLLFIMNLGWSMQFLPALRTLMFRLLLLCICVSYELPISHTDQQIRIRYSESCVISEIAQAYRMKASSSLFEALTGGFCSFGFFSPLLMAMKLPANVTPRVAIASQNCTSARDDPCRNPTVKTALEDLLGETCNMRADLTSKDSILGNHNERFTGA